VNVVNVKLVAIMAVAVLVLGLAGCSSGSITNSQQSCESSGGFLQDREMSCTGSAGTIKGSPSLSIADVDEEFSGTYKLDATVEVGEGTVRATVANAIGDEVGGEVSPGEPLQISETVELSETDEELSLSLKVAGGEEAEASDLTYESRLTPQN
jgi:hypothetical protein